MNPSSPFTPSSRYYNVPIRSLTLPDGREIKYVARRLLPRPEAFSVLQEYTVQEGDRLDNLAASLLGDPEQFWRLCDANGAMNPDELTEHPGQVLRITLPEGIQPPR